MNESGERLEGQGEASLATEVASPPTMKELLSSQWWRLNNLYMILNEEGKQVRFKPNEAQKVFYGNLHTRNVVLKGRQIGLTTFIDLLILDTCLFNRGVEAVILGDTVPNSEDIFRRKIMYPYEHLPVEVRETITPKEGTKGSAGQLQLSNDSIISVAVSARSGTAQIIHSTELAKVAALNPDKADEFVTGTLPAAKSKNALIFIESTARGATGVFYDYCKLAMNTAADVKAGIRVMHELDWQFHFFPWWIEKGYTLPQAVVIPQGLKDYFEMLSAKHGIKLTDGQKNWYATKWSEIGDRMRSEYPSYKEECFEVVIKGAFFTQQIADMRKGGRLCKVPHQKGIEVHTAWDIGIDDYTVIWFFQECGKEIHVIDYFEASDEGLDYYRGILDQKTKDLGYRYGKHFGPHDLAVREFTAGAISRWETARKMGLYFKVVPKPSNKADPVEAARNFFSRCWFDAERAGVGVNHLELYSHAWDKNRGMYKDSALHDEHSHGADAFMTLAMGMMNFGGSRGIAAVKVETADYTW